MVVGITGALKPEAAFPVDMHGTMVMTSVTEIDLSLEQIELLKNTVLTARSDMHKVFQVYTGC